MADSTKSKKHNKQHRARAASFKRIAKCLRIRAANYRSAAKITFKDAKTFAAKVLRDIAAEFDNEAATLRAMR
jgi:hypothetical protein